jgi:hypothetical protein
MGQDRHRAYRFEVRSDAPGRSPCIVSRHHYRGTAERRLLRMPIEPGETVTILEDGEAVRVCRCPETDEAGILF